MEQIKAIVPSVTVTWAKHSGYFSADGWALNSHLPAVKGRFNSNSRLEMIFGEQVAGPMKVWSVNGCSFQLVLLCEGPCRQEFSVSG